MFEATIEDSALFRKIIEALKDIIKEGNFECSEQGITFQGVDSSFVALVQLTLRRQGFTHYRVDDTINLGINIENILKLLKCGSAKDKLTLSSQDDSDTLNLEFSGEDRISKFNHKLMVIDNETLTVPTLQYTTSCVMPSSEFQRIIRDLGSLGDYVDICINSEAITFSVNSATASGSISLKTGSTDDDKKGPVIKIKAEEELTQTFTVRYLNSFAKAASLSEQVQLKLSPEAPFCVDFRIVTRQGEETAAFGALRFFLAPKSEENEEEN